jgi:hypothetical protein
MSYKKMLTPIAVLLFVYALGFALTHVWGMSLKDIVVGIIAYTLYGVFVALYFLRFVLIFIGVFAVYRILQERHNRQLAV